MTRVVLSSRWFVAGLLAADSALSYFDRQSFPVIVGEISKTIPLSDLQYARLQFLFPLRNSRTTDSPDAAKSAEFLFHLVPRPAACALLTYGVMYAGGGRLIDLLGTGRGYVLCMFWWSLATALHGLVHSVPGLAFARVLLGLGEGGGFPASAKAVSESFPAGERSLAFGIFNAGSSIGAIVAPPAIAALSIAFGWRMVFLLAGAGGIVWAITWAKSYRALAAAEATWAPPWREFLRQRDTWALLVGALIRRGVTLNLSRRITLGVAAALLPLSLFIAASPKD